MLEEFRNVNGLTGAQAVERLERRSGQVVVFRKGHVPKLAFTHAAPEKGHAVVYMHNMDGRPNHQRQEFVLRTDADRASLALAMETARDEANAQLHSLESGFELIHRDQLQTDSGYGEIGCLFVVVSVVVGLVVGLIGGWIATGRFVGFGPLVGPVVGFLVGMFATDSLAALAVNVSPLRDRVPDLAMWWSLIVPGIITAVIVIVMTILAA